MFKKSLKWLGLFLGLLLLAAFIFYRYFSDSLVDSMQQVAVYNAGLQTKQVIIDDYTLNYYEGGQPNGMPLVLLHGILDDKNAFIRCTDQLSKEYRIILPDLIGHGANLPLPSLDYSISAQVNSLGAFLSKNQLIPCILGGFGLGGHLAAAYTSRNPDQVKSLILINATGVSNKGESVYRPLPEKVDQEFMDTYFEDIFFNSPNIPDQFVAGIKEQLQRQVPFTNKIIEQIIKGEELNLNEQLKGIVVPTLILWGKQNGVIPSSYAQVFHELIPKSTLKILDQAAHSMHYEIPERVQKEIIDFLDKK